jgi:hypothetical protein
MHLARSSVSGDPLRPEPCGASKAFKSTSSAAGATLTVKLHLITAQAAKLSRIKLSKTHSLTTTLRLAFTPKRGKKLTKTVTVTFG